MKWLLPKSVNLVLGSLPSNKRISHRNSLARCKNLSHMKVGDFFKNQSVSNQEMASND